MLSIGGVEIGEELPSALEGILEELKRILPDGMSGDLASGALDVGALFERVLSELSGGSVREFFIMAAGSAALVAAIEHLVADKPAVALSGLIAAVPLFSSLSSLAQSVRLGIEEGSSFFSLLIPVLSATTAAAGYSETAAVQSIGMNFTLAFVSGLLSEYLLGAALLFFALSLLSAADTGSFTSGVASGIKGLLFFLLGLVSTVIVAVSALQSLVATGVDGMAMRGLKYAISGSIPVIGSTVSGALSFLCSGVGFVSKTVGVASVIAILFIMGAPLLNLLAYRICLALCVSFLDFLSCENGKRVFVSLRASIDLLIAVFVSAGLVYLMQIIIFIRSLSGAVGL
jgi:stage III sporulation protein AE